MDGLGDNAHSPAHLRIGAGWAVGHASHAEVYFHCYRSPPGPAVPDLDRHFTLVLHAKGLILKKSPYTVTKESPLLRQLGKCTPDEMKPGLIGTKPTLVIAPERVISRSPATFEDRFIAHPSSTKMPETPPEPIAIVGIGCRFPGGASSPSKLWELLKQPFDVSQEVPADRFNISRFYHPNGSHHGTTNVKRSYFLSESIRSFDTEFFGIPPSEAEPMDPQHRVLLEVVYEAIQSAGMTLERLYGSDTAAYVGLMCSDYYVLQAHDLNFVPTYNATGVANSNASSRISYFFNWHGPSMTIDTACSSSLVAIHEAVQALRSGRSEMAIAAGTNLLLSPLPYISESKLHMLSPTGRSRMWDADADGYARGEGVAAVALKTLSAALRDGDPIEGVIRETGVNQDGRTRGITMPSAQAQASLIQDTYVRAGLNPTNKADRCQYFEAHGTGTPAGDPQEAEALSLAFFSTESQEDKDVLHVGSVKTVIGHTEGTAGVAGLIKACMALRDGFIPPNMLFNRPNPSLECFTSHLRVPITLQDWPAVPAGSPRRASVNSFGFGGTNAHAILESYCNPMKKPYITPEITENDVLSDCILSPFVFSAASHKALAAMLNSFSAYLQDRQNINLRHLSHSLATKRSCLPVKLAITASSHRDLCNRIESHIQDKGILGTLSSLAVPSILGVFTGQGAQWATMGTKLIHSCARATSIIESLDRSLAALPEPLRPRWSLMRELLAEQDSRIGEAEICQPLCTAVQIMLVDLLQSSGITFAAVVGHSSGEIAAAYAAGFLSAQDAIRVAFLRGYAVKQARESHGRYGSMMAVGTTFDDAVELCNLEEFKGNLCVAAHNSGDSITLSGDADAIHAAKAVFDEESKFSRILKVDTAYHSHHMNAAAVSYLDMLRKCKTKVLEPPPGAPKWVSSVKSSNTIMDKEALGDYYWVENMQQPVLFASAVESCFQIAAPAMNFVLEIGPHPALRGPVNANIQTIVDTLPHYSGTLSRGVDDREAFATAVGSIWTQLGHQAVDFERVERTLYEDFHSLEFLSDLPLYSWDHDRRFWAESRSTRLFRTQNGQIHDLLGVRSEDGTAEEWRWHNVLKTQELPWLLGHALQGQTVFPGTGYVALAMEASLQLAGDRPVAMIELCDLKIRKAIAINDTMGTEISVTMTDISTVGAEDVEVVTANFSTYSTISRESNAMGLNTSGHVRITFGANATEMFPPRSRPTVDLVPVAIDRFYSAMRDDLGYMYEGAFRGLTSLQRRLGFSSGTIAKPQPVESETPLLFHPGMLDNALQGLFGAYSAPGDGRLWSMRAPTACRRVTLIPSLCGADMTDEIAFDCTVTDPRDDFITGDVDIYSSGYSQKIIEFEGLSFSPFAAATEHDDRHLFQESLHFINKPDGAIVLGDRKPTEAEKQKALDAERAAFFYLRTLHEMVDDDTRGALPWYRQALLDNAERVVRLVQEGRHAYAPLAWLDDTHVSINAMMNSYGDQDADFNLTKAVGENLGRPSVLSGETNILEYMTKNNYLDKYYTHAIGFGWLNYLISGIISQITTKYPHMDICEIGAGTGGATGAILETIGASFASYTYTDISSAFFEKAQDRFQAHGKKMQYKTLDIEKDPTEQGFNKHSYDLVLAANVLHATKSVQETLRNTHSLLKPGGFLVLMEIVGNDVFRIGLVMGGLPGWWIGKEDGRRYAPTITLERWDSVMRQTGFSGVDTHTPMPDKVQMPGSVFVTQALDNDISRLRSPLAHSPTSSSRPKLLIIGGQTEESARLVHKVSLLVEPHFSDVQVARALQEVISMTPGTYVLSLAEYDRPLFESYDDIIWECFKKLVSSLGGLLWVTSGSQQQRPYAGITLGLLRSLFYEVPESPLQLLDIDDSSTISPLKLAEMLIQLHLCGNVRNEKHDQMVWTVEPELFLKDNRLYMLRVQPQEEQNDRYNSARRLITRERELGLVTLALDSRCTGGKYAFLEAHSSLSSPGEDIVTISLESSLLSSIKTPCGYFFVCLGVDQHSQQRKLCFSTANSSVITTPRAMAVDVEDDQIIDVQYMTFVVARLISQQTVDMVPPSGTFLIHEPDPGLASLISKQITAQGRNVVFTTSQLQNKSRRGWVYLHERCVDRAINEVLPLDISFVLDLATSSLKPGMGARIAGSRGQPCELATLYSLIRKEPSRLPNKIPLGVTELLQRADSFASSQLNAVPEGALLEIYSRQDIASNSFQPSPTSLIRWQEGCPVPVLVQPITERADLFQNDRAYWLAGLAGDLGLSLADFMIEHGARYIALSSRNPPAQSSWVNNCAKRGVHVSFFACDLVDLASVQTVHKQITQTMAPIGGVANGALLLHDISIASMSSDAFQTVVKPKVNGTANLDRVCCNDTLDWFIGFSSIVATTGNMGQAAYSAANCFIKALVNNRRSKGLAGSVIDISRVLGVGYVERETKKEGRLTKEQTERLMNRTGTLPMSEPDLHQLFAEAILAGRSGAGSNSELITGLSPVTPDEAKDIFWARNPKFGLLIRDQGTGRGQSSSAVATQISLKAQLQAAESMVEVATLVIDNLLNKLRTTLFLSAGDALSPERPLIDLGVDSLVAVDVRTWLLKELAVDLPVLRILGGASASDLAADIMEKLPSEVVKTPESVSGGVEHVDSVGASNSEQGKLSPLSQSLEPTATSVGGGDISTEDIGS